MTARVSELPRPEVYHDRRAGTWLITPIALLVAIEVALIVLLKVFGRYTPTYFSYAFFVFVVGTMIIIFFGGRTLWDWARNPRHCDPDDGNFVTKSRMNLLLALPGSPDDVVELDSVKKIDTPSSRFASKYFNSSKLVLDGRVFKHVKNVDHILAIAQYRRSLRSRELNRTEELIELQQESNDLQRETNTLLRQLIEAVAGQQADTADEYREDTTAIPIQPRQVDADTDIDADTDRQE